MSGESESDDGQTQTSPDEAPQPTEDVSYPQPTMEEFQKDYGSPDSETRDG